MMSTSLQITLNYFKLLVAVPVNCQLDFLTPLLLNEVTKRNQEESKTKSKRNTKYI
jgi:hypothetical protein